MRTYFDRPLAVALFVGAVLLAWWSLTVQFNYNGNWTALFCTGSNLRHPAELEKSTYLFPNSNGYDGQFYRYIAHDPLLRRYGPSVDDIRLRHARILIPVLAWTAVVGYEPLVDFAYIAVVLLSVALGVYYTAGLARHFGRSALWGAAFLLVPGVLASIDRMLLDASMATVAAMFAYALITGRTRLLWVALVLAPLIRETGFLLTGAVGLSSLLERRLRPAVIAALTAAPAVLWTAYVATTAGKSTAAIIIGRPVYGQVMRIFSHPFGATNETVVLLMNGLESLAMVAFLIAAVLALRFWWMRKTGTIEIAGIAFALLGLSLGQPIHVREAFGYSRPMAPLFFFLMAQFLAGRSRLAFAVSPPVAAPVAMYFAYQALRIAMRLANGL